MTPWKALAEEFLARHRNGEKPSANEYVDQYPQWANEIQELFPTLLLMEKLGQPSLPGRPSTTNSPFKSYPAQFGDYLVLRMVGSGGMGIVFEAVHRSLDRHVALKILPVSQVEEDVQRERFRREARAAAQLHHSNIVPIFDVGEVDGILFYAMQFIEGIGLDQVVLRRRNIAISKAADGKNEITVESRGKTPANHQKPAADDTVLMQNDSSLDDARGHNRKKTAHGSSTNSFLDQSVEFDPGDLTANDPHAYFRAVAKIGIQVADALQFIEQSRLVHRDIKPSNLILDNNGRVWLTDFGLARFTEADDLTRNGGIVGTMRYMAPERFQSESTHKSDIYGLGATLYELATSKPVFDQQDKVKLMEQIINDDAVPPRKINPAVPIDLETIVQKMIEKNPDRRYGQANDVAVDLRRWLDHLPIRARRISPLGHVVRWTQRKPMVATLLSIIVVVVIVAFVLIFQQWQNARWHQHRAEQNLEKSQQVVRDFHVQVAGGWGSLYSTPGSQHLRRDLLLSARKYFQEFLDENETTATRYQVAYANYCLGDLAIEFGEMDDAEKHFQLALDSTRQIPSNSHTTEIVHLLAQIKFGLANIRAHTGNREKAIELLKESESFFQDLSQLQPSSLEFKSGLASTLAKLGMCSHQVGEFENSKAYFKNAIKLQQSICEKSDSSVALRAFAKTLKQHGDLLKELGEPSRSIKSLKEALVIHKEIEKETGSVDWNQLDTGDTCESLGSIYRQQLQYQKSIETYDTGIAALRAASNRNPAVPFYRSQLANLLSNAGNVLSEMGNRKLAQERFEEALKIKQALADQFPEILHFKSTLANSLYNLAIADRNVRNQPLAIKRFNESIKLLEALLKIDPTSRVDLQQLMASKMELGVCYSQTSQMDAAVQSLLGAIAVYERLPSQSDNTLSSENQLARTHLELALSKARRYQLANGGRFPPGSEIEQQCREHILQALTIAQRLANEDPGYVDFKRTLALVHYDTAMIDNASLDFKQAATNCQLAIDILNGIVETQARATKDTQALADRLNYLAGIFSRMKDPEQCKTASLKVVQLRKQLVDDYAEPTLFKRDLAMNCMNLATLQTYLSDKVEFLVAAAEAFESIPTDELTNFEREAMASCYHRLAYSLNTESSVDEAIEYWKKSVDIKKQLFERDPNQRRHHSLAISYASYADALKKRMDFDLAKQQYQSALAIMQALIQQSPDAYSFQLGALSIRLDRAELDHQIGQTNLAIQQLKSAQTDARELIKLYPNNTSGQKLIDRCDELQKRFYEKSQ